MCVCTVFGPGGVTVFNSITLIHPGCEQDPEKPRIATSAGELEMVEASIMHHIQEVVDKSDR